MDLIFPLLILFMIGLVFMSSRQRKKQENQQKSLQGSLNVGDVVVMTSGVSGTIVDVDDERTIDLEIAPDVVTTWLRAAVREKLVAPEDPEVVEDLDESDDVVPAVVDPDREHPGRRRRHQRHHVTETNSDIKDTKADSTDNVSSPRSS